MTCNGLLLPGGGARAAYQVGVLKALAELRPRDRAATPFRVISGNSAGCINAAVLASRAMDFHGGVDELAGIWSNLQVSKVFRTDTWTMLSNSMKWLWAIIRGELGTHGAHSLLDNTPLRELLERHIRFARIQQAIHVGHLDAFAVTASGYTSARSVTFFTGRPGLEGWQRTRREGRPEDIGLDHLMASSALPLIFPAVRIGAEYFGDGSMRQGAPLAAPIHLGAERILVIGVRDEQPDRPERIGLLRPRYPSFGQIMGYILDTLFMDSLYLDLERLKRVNELLEHAGRRMKGTGLRPIDVTVVIPSRDIRDITARYVRRLPRSVKLLLRGLGGLRPGGRQLASYLLFDGGFCSELIELGYADAMAQKDRLMPFTEA